MMNHVSNSLDVNQKLGHLVTQYPALVGFCVAHDLDFCCGGQKTLAEHCDASGLSPVDTAEAMRVFLASQHSNEEPPNETVALLDYIVNRFHMRHRQQFPTIQTLLAKVCDAHGSRYPWLIPLQTNVNALIEDLEPHMVKEEQVLFPLLRGETDNLPPGLTPHMPMNVLRMEHEDAGQMLATIQTLKQGNHPPADACRSFQALYDELAILDRDLRLHIHLENNVLFPRFTEEPA